MKILSFALAPLLTLLSLSPAFAGELYTFESDASGFNTKNYFYDNGQEVVAFDTQFTPALAEKSIAFLRTKTSNPISYVVITHPNPDKFNGASAFQKLGAKVVASSHTAQNIPGVHAYKKYFFVHMAKMFTENEYPAEAKVDMTFKKSLELKLKNGDMVSLKELSGPGVSTDQTVASIPSLKAMIVGDLIHHKAHAWLEGGIVKGKAKPTLSSWISDLKEIEKMGSPEVTVYGGRGESAKLTSAVAAQIAYLKKADEVVTRLVKQNGDQTAAIQAELEKAFPDYQLPYMIQFGVYGLIDSKL